jgi:hypothetical protein
VLTLYKVGTRGRVQLDDLATEGDFYMVAKDEEGVIVLSPVQVATTGTKRTVAGDQDALPLT